MFLKSQSNADFQSAIRSAVDTASVELLDDGPRSHMGASEIGEKCERYLWYKFRWIVIEKFKPQMLRLFNRGHREEPFLAKLLEKAGFDVQLIDPVTGKQFQFSACDGHFGGSCDGVAYLLAGSELGKKFPQWVDVPLLVEFKTKATGRGFDNLCTSGVRVSEPKHYAQRSVYSMAFDLDHTIYVTVNKNDDDLYIEFDDVDKDAGARFVDRAYDIIHSPNPPARLHEQPEHQDCKYCPAKNLCQGTDDHNKARVPQKNCRSCSHCTPVENAEWHCGQHGSIIPKDFLPLGCGDWRSIA